MLDFFTVFFFAIGFTISIFGIGYGAMSLTEAIQKANKQRQERYDRLLAAIERIQAEIRNHSQNS